VLIGHGDWYAGNLRFEDDQVVAAFDWDLIVEPEPVIAGLSAGGFLAASAPTADEVGGFLADFDDARRGIFTAAQWRMATAAARWVLAFNARCDLSMLAGNADPGSALGRLSDDMDAYRRIAP
jgi:hypothetical protein